MSTKVDWKEKNIEVINYISLKELCELITGQLKTETVIELIEEILVSDREIFETVKNWCNE